ncbi:type IV toxin-antitoxin system AbiEi family antitoxin [Burkholderia sp. IT-111MI5]|uniref:type IV toxin-antitoxin system AbiEi family antitoxin n=1 Tax=Burkholderia sp. IT-111MI5 TaxID=3026439 RepID=UPI0039E0F17F
MEKPAQSQKVTARLTYEAEVADELCAALAEATDGQIVTRQAEQPTGDGLRLDLLITLLAGGKSADIAVETLRHAYPRDIREAIWRLDEYKLASERPQDLLTMVAAESLSPGARDMLRKRGIGYFERNGNLFLRWRNWFINIERPEQASARKAVTALFTDAREMVVHALLEHRNEWITGGDLAYMTKSSSYTCSVVLQELERREWCESVGAGRTIRRRLIRPRQLLDAWAEHWTKREEQRTRWYSFADRPEVLLTHLSHKLSKSGVSFDYAFTGTAAANLYAPLLTSVDTAEIIVSPGHAEQLAKTLQLKPADKGANVTLVERTGASLLFRDLRGVRPDEYPSYFASPFILYLDLLDGRGRNKELAQHVLERLEL